MDVSVIGALFLGVLIERPLLFVVHVRASDS